MFYKKALSSLVFARFKQGPVRQSDTFYVHGFSIVYYLSYSEEEENLDESVVVLDDDEDEEIDEGIVHLCTYRTPFCQVFSYILRLRKKHSR